MPFSPKVSQKPLDCETWWSKQSQPFPSTGEVGLSCAGDRLFWRDEEGVLLGFLSYYPKGVFGRRLPGEITVAVAPSARRQGIGMKLIKEAVERWDIQAKKQRYTPASAALTEAWLKERRDNNT